MSGTASDTTAGVSLGGAATTGDSGSGGNSQPAQAGATTTPAPGSQGTEGSAQAAWYGTVEDQGLKQLADSKGWKAPADALKAYKELETAFSSRGEVPKPPATANDYKFEVPADLPKDSYNEAFEGWFKGAAHKSGLSQEVAAGLHGSFIEYAKAATAATAQAQQQQTSERVTKAMSDLTSKWGQMGTPNFTRNLELAKRAIRMTDPGMMDALKEVGAIVDVGGEMMIANSTLFKAFSSMGQGMFAEDNLYGDPASDKNPFDDKTEDPAMQGRLIKEDPDKAASLIKAAGKDKMFAQFLERHKSGRR